MKFVKAILHSKTFPSSKEESNEEPNNATKDGVPREMIKSICNNLLCISDSKKCWFALQDIMWKSQTNLEPSMSTLVIGQQIVFNKQEKKVQILIQ